MQQDSNFLIFQASFWRLKLLLRAFREALSEFSREFEEFTEYQKLRTNINRRIQYCREKHGHHLVADTNRIHLHSDGQLLRPYHCQRCGWFDWLPETEEIINSRYFNAPNEEFEYDVCPRTQEDVDKWFAVEAAHGSWLLRKLGYDYTNSLRCERHE